MDDPGPSSAYYNSFASTSTGPIHPISPPHSPLLHAHRDPQETQDSFTHDALYSTLNLDRSASTSEIKDAYRSLASTFHPDRQRDESSKAAAHGRFQEIQRAYEVLSDPSRRTVYDLMGEEGLRTNWEVGPRNMTPQEMKSHYSRQVYEIRQMEAESMVKSKGSMDILLDARAVFISRSVFDRPERIAHDPISRVKRMRQGRVSMKHSFEVPWNDKTQVVWSGQMASRGGKGGANVLGTLRHQWSPRLWFEVGSSLMAPRVATGKATYTHDENTFVTVNAVQSDTRAPPRISVTVGRKLYAWTTGFITYKSGFYEIGSWGAYLPPELSLSDRSALSVGLTTSKQDGAGWTVQTSAGLNNSNVSADWSTRILGLRVKIGAEAGLEDGVTGFLDAEGKVTEYVRIGSMLQAALAGGITMKLRFSRLGQRVSIPILLAHDLDPYVLAGATLIPMTGYLALYRFVIQPKKKRELAERVHELRTDHADYIAQKKQEAQEAISIMERPTAQKAARERETDGLVILGAWYGRSESFTDRGMRHSSSPHSKTTRPGTHSGNAGVNGTGQEEDEGFIDVTIPIQSLVNDHKLVIPSGRPKHGLIGFWDPCLGENKKLRVRYLFKGKLHQVTVDDSAAVRAPLRAHALE